LVSPTQKLSNEFKLASSQMIFEKLSNEKALVLPPNRQKLEERLV